MPDQVVIILGSRSDLTKLEESNALNILREVGISYKVSILSAHRNPVDLMSYSQRKDREGTLVFIGAASMNAALPGVIAAHIPHKPVIGVPLASEGFPNALDATLAMTRMPPGKPVLVCPGFQNAAISACQIIGLFDQTVSKKLQVYLTENQKKPEMDILSSQEEQ